jgi:DNA-binding response OmpR family regulator
VNPPIVILLVEDDPNDAFFVTRALEKLGFTGTVEHALDIDAAKSYLSKTSNDASSQQVSMVIADSAVSSRGSGVDLLEWMRKKAEYSEIPFIILSGEVSSDTKRRADAAGVDFVLIKHSDSTHTVEQLRRVFLDMASSNTRRPISFCK